MEFESGQQRGIENGKRRKDFARASSIPGRPGFPLSSFMASPIISIAASHSGSIAATCGKCGADGRLDYQRASTPLGANDALAGGAAYIASIPMAPIGRIRVIRPSTYVQLSQPSADAHHRRANTVDLCQGTYVRGLGTGCQPGVCLRLWLPGAP